MNLKSTKISKSKIVITTLLFGVNYFINFVIN